MEQEFEFFAEGDSELEGTQKPTEERILKVRLDKWLWAARFFKTRALACAAVEAGRIFYNGQRSKASREIELGAIINIRHGRFEKTVIVRGLSTRRRSIEEALQLFEETEASKSAREQTNEWQQPSQSSYRSEKTSAYPQEQRERRVVRFLRRSFIRQGEARTDRSPSIPPSGQQEFEKFD